MTTPRIIQIAGPARVGKSTTAHALAAQLRILGKRAGVASYAGCLYQIVSLLTDLPEDWLRANKSEVIGLEQACNPAFLGRTPREILQTVGEGMRQSFGPHVWVGHLRRLLADDSENALDFVIMDDARHVAEFVLGPVVELQRVGVAYACNHPSAMPPPEEHVWIKLFMDDRTPVQVAEAIVINMRAEGMLEGEA